MHFRLLVWLAMFASVMGLAASPGAMAQGGEKKKQGSVKAANAVPGNYRQLITRHFAANNVVRSGAVSAQISRPGLWQDPLGLAGPAPIICVKWTTQGSQYVAMLIFRFHEGQIYEALNPETVKYGGGLFGVMLLKSVTCDKLSYGPYPEISKLPRPKR